jgi:hypothetical protein
MKTRKLEGLATALVVGGVTAAVIVACGPSVPPVDEGSTGIVTGSTTTAGETRASADETTGPKLDLADETGDTPLCQIDDTCDALDILFVIDNSGTMGEEQLNVARHFPLLVDEIVNLTDGDGSSVEPNVNIMVTTTDVGHPLCTPLNKPDYEPRRGAPVYQGCNARIERFTGLDPIDPVVIEEACTEGCPVDVVPDDHFIHFSTLGSNVPGDDIAAALSCIGPQGIDGCSYEAPLEAMMLALDETACWNDPEQPECDEQAEWADATAGFLRESATLVVVIISDGMDCSVAPDGYSFFTDVDDAIYWNVDPVLGIPQASPAICFNAGVSCIDDDGDGIYEDCTVTDDGVLHPVDRYVAYLDDLTEVRGKEVVMLGVMGVPEVVAHNPSPPFQPIAGGAVDLVYRHWVDAPYSAGDILPAEWDAGLRAADKIFELGNIGPGCTGTNELGAFTGQAIPPLRMLEVCESLDFVDEETGDPGVRCCIESICDTDFSPVMRCLGDLTVGPEPFG